MATFRFHPSQYLIRMGDYNLVEEDPGESEIFQVSLIKIHQRFVYRGFYNDVALFKLARAVQFSDYIQPVCLPADSQRTETFVGSSPVLTGWGVTSYGGQHSHILQEVAVPVWRNADCDAAYYQSITDVFLCAGYQAGGKDGCQVTIGKPHGYI